MGHQHHSNYDVLGFQTKRKNPGSPLVVNIEKLFFQVGLATPKPNPDETPSATFGHMLSMLFQWFNATAYLPSDKTGNAESCCSFYN